VRAILRSLGKALIASAATASVISMAAAPGLATTATTWTVKPGGGVFATSGTATLTDVTALQTVQCSFSTAKGSFTKGTGLSGTGIGNFLSISFTACALRGVPVTLDIAGDMPVNALKYSPVKKIVNMTVTHMHGGISINLCSAAIDGTSGTANNGMVKARYMDTGATMKVLTTGGNLHLYNVVNCQGLLNSNDVVDFTATYKVRPAQTITSP
jgi:hypothetical protein